MNKSKAKLENNCHNIFINQDQIKLHKPQGINVLETDSYQKQSSRCKIRPHIDNGFGFIADKNV